MPSVVKKMSQDPLTGKIIGAAITVHKTLGPGLLESVYHRCLAHELCLSNIRFKSEVPLPVHYKEISLDCGYRIDMIVEDQVILELKAVKQFQDVYTAQILTYMKLAGIKTGLLINFNVRRLKDGIKRFKL